MCHGNNNNVTVCLDKEICIANYICFFYVKETVYIGTF